MTISAKSIILLLILVGFGSCSVLEQSSRHGFESGYYKLSSRTGIAERVYVNVGENDVVVYQKKGDQTGPKTMSIPLTGSDSLCHYPVKFSKSSLDIDITTNLLKFRPSVYGLPAQMTLDFNAAIYTGWRRDHYRIRSKQTPLGLCQYEVVNRGYDLGLFAGPGTTTINPFSTRDAVVNEYNGVILQYGLAGFIESNVASFGFSVGFDHLFSPDRKVWIYDKKPWFGFVVGIALN
jgi:hypothetical protein